MANFDTSRIKIFTIPGDVVNVYAMIDASIVANAKAGLTIPQQAAIDAFVWTPTATQLFGDPGPPVVLPVCSIWAGNDPPAVYFKANLLLLQAALAKYYK